MSMLLHVWYFSRLPWLVGNREIAESHRRVVDGEVESEHLAERWGGNDGRRHDIVVVVALRKYLIVALSEVRSEHQTYEWHLCLVTNLERTFPHPESIGCGGVGRKVEAYVACAGLLELRVL